MNDHSEVRGDKVMMLEARVELSMTSVGDKTHTPSGQKPNTTLNTTRV